MGVLLKTALTFFCLGIASGNCPSKAWYKFKDKCYLYKTEEATFFENMLFCKEMNATLVSIHSAEENEYLRKILPSDKVFWIGLRQVADGMSTYSWLDHSPVNYVNWAAGEPNALSDIPWATDILNGKWYDWNANKPWYQLCQYSVSVKKSGGITLLEEIRDRLDKQEKVLSSLGIKYQNVAEIQKDTLSRFSDQNARVTGQLKTVMDDMRELKTKLKSLTSN